MLSTAVRGFIFFIVLNGAVVFADGWARLIGIAAVGSVIGAVVWSWRQTGMPHPATGSQRF
jgi:hypothetical protein